MIALIPSINESPYLYDMLDVLHAEPCISRIVIVHNDDDPIEFPVGVISIHAPTYTIYEGWNIGIRAGTVGNEHVALLNDDLILPPGSLTTALEGFDDPDYGLIGLNYGEPGEGVKQVSGTYRTGGFGGFAFVVAPGCPLVDPGFQWWYGDDDLAKRILQAGKKLGVHLGAPVKHPHPSTTGHYHAWTNAAIQEDERLFVSIWGSVW